MVQRTPKKKPTSKRTSGEQQIREFFAEDWTPRTHKVNRPEQALTLSPFFAGIKLYTSIVSSLPLVTYTREGDDGRKRAKDNPAYEILHDQPNPAQTRAVFVEQLVRNLFLLGNAYALIQRDGEGTLLNLFPVDPSTVNEVLVDPDWNKAYVVDGRAYGSDEVLHFMMNSRDGIQGVPLLHYAGEALGLHKQVQESANSYYRNAVRTPFYIKNTAKLDMKTRKDIEEFFRDRYAGTVNSGKVPVLVDSEIVAMPSTTASDQQLIEALGTSVADVGRWLNLSPIALGDYSAAHYASLSADNVYLYQRSIAPFLCPIELELNNKLFPEEDVYCEFLVDQILRGDPKEQADTLNVYIQNGTLTRNEARAIANRDSLDGLDVPLQPVNMEPATPTEQAPTEEAPAAIAPTESTTVQDTALNGAQVASLLAITDKVAAKLYPAAAAVAIIKASFPALSETAINEIVTSLTSYTAPTPQEVTNADTQPASSV